MKNSLILIILLLSLLTNSCGSVQEHRIRHKRSTYENATKEQQVAMFNGQVLTGFSELMVYISMGQARAIKKNRQNPTWYYIGIGETAEEFKTTMDLIFSSPKNFKMLEIQFQAGKVASMEVKEIDWETLRDYPNKHSPAAARHL